MADGIRSNLVELFKGALPRPKALKMAEEVAIPIRNQYLSKKADSDLAVLNTEKAVIESQIQKIEEKKRGYDAYLSSPGVQESLPLANIFVSIGMIDEKGMVLVDDDEDKPKRNSQRKMLLWEKVWAERKYDRYIDNRSLCVFILRTMGRKSLSHHEITAILRWSGHYPNHPDDVPESLLSVDGRPPYRDDIEAWLTNIADNMRRAVQEKGDSRLKWDTVRDGSLSGGRIRLVNPNCITPPIVKAIWAPRSADIAEQYKAIIDEAEHSGCIDLMSNGFVDSREPVRVMVHQVV